MDKAKDLQEEKMGNANDHLLAEVVNANENITDEKINRLVTPDKYLKWFRLARSTHSLEMQAMLKEYGQKYDSSSLPTGRLKLQIYYI